MKLMEKNIFRNAIVTVLNSTISIASSLKKPE